MSERKEVFFSRLAIGLLVPATNVVMEPELNKMAPEGVAIYTERIVHKGAKSTDTFYEAIKRLADDIPEAAKRLSFANPDIVVFGCTSGSFIEGEDWNQKISQEIRNIIDVPVITASSGVVEALKALGAKRIAVGTPYPDDVNERLRAFLRYHGFEVVRMGSVPYVYSKSVYAAYKLVKRLDGEDIDALLISCTDFATLNVLGLLEEECRKPVVSSNQATMWACLRLGRVKGDLRQFGMLFDVW